MLAALYLPSRYTSLQAIINLHKTESFSSRALPLNKECIKLQAGKSETHLDAGLVENCVLRLKMEQMVAAKLKSSRASLPSTVSYDNLVNVMMAF